MVVNFFLVKPLTHDFCRKKNVSTRCTRSLIVIYNVLISQSSLILTAKFEVKIQASY